MSGASYPIQMCDSEFGCDQWEIDHEATGARFVDPTASPLREWKIDRQADTALCPEHKEADDDR